MEHLFLFSLYQISFCDAPFHYLVQCKHTLSKSLKKKRKQSESIILVSISEWLSHSRELFFICKTGSIIKSGYVHTVPDSETERKNCTKKGFCSHWEHYFRNNFCSGAGLLCSVSKRYNICNAMEHLFLFTLYQISFCDAPFHHLVQCKHTLSKSLKKKRRASMYAEKTQQLIFTYATVNEVSNLIRTRKVLLKKTNLHFQPWINRLTPAGVSPSLKKLAPFPTPRNKLRLLYALKRDEMS